MKSLVVMTLVVYILKFKSILCFTELHVESKGNVSEKGKKTP